MIAVNFCLVFLFALQASSVYSDNDWGPRGYVNVKFDCGYGILRSYQRHWYGTAYSEEPVLISADCSSTLVAPDRLKTTEITKMSTFEIEWSNEFWLDDYGWSWKGDYDFRCTGKCNTILYNNGTQHLLYDKNKSTAKAIYGKEYFYRAPNDIYSTLIMSRPHHTDLETCKIQPRIYSSFNTCEQYQ